MIKKIKLLASTVPHLKPKQIQYQLLYRLLPAKKLLAYKQKIDLERIRFLYFNQLPPVYSSYIATHHFNFLNITHEFPEEIDWNIQEYGKLWNYNLQYANYLLQEEISIDDKLRLLRSLHQALETDKLALEPYPVSLRSINSIRLFSVEKIKERDVLENLHAELNFLSKRPEYHLLGNHLLENAFALLMGGAFFSNQEWVQQGQKILLEELDEQILSDGAHFELSPMYHQIILFRLLELIDWYKNWDAKEVEFLAFLENKASLMLAWLRNISFSNGDIPHFNDSAEGIAYSAQWLSSYAILLNISEVHTDIQASGYRSFKNINYECKVDLAQIGPSYQPGHAQADALSFILYYKEKPLFVEMGTSTYEINERRALERGTSAHNTVVVNNTDQSKVWSGFRVAQRAKTEILEDKISYLVGKHDGYRNIGVTHTRIFEFKQDSVLIADNIKGNFETVNQFHLHLYPTIKIEEPSSDMLSIIGVGYLHFVGATKIEVLDYDMANGYNHYLPAKKIIVTFEKSLLTTIQFKE